LTENTIKTVKIQKIIDECKDVKTIFFNMKSSDVKNHIFPRPGQFVMVWVPGVDEIPMSLSGYDDNANWFITVKNVGECTNAIHNLNVGDFIGVRGPLGNSFEVPKKNSKKIFLVGGGIGTAPLKFLASELLKMKYNITIIEGAKDKNELVFIKDFQTFSMEYSNVLYCTDDGSYGLNESAPKTFVKVIKNYSKEEFLNLSVYACGPEIMLYKIFQFCDKFNINLQVSLERIMRCGCGLCGLCTIDPLGLLVCNDGPIFNLEVLKKMEDFGKFKRDFTGKKIPLD